MKLPRFYRKAEKDQSHHDYYTLRFFIRLAQDIKKAGYRTERVSKGRLPFEGFRFRPDRCFWVEKYFFPIEAQLSDLTETRWPVKFKNYIRLRQAGIKHNPLFIIDQKGDMAYVRRHARQAIQRLPEHFQRLFLFINLAEMKGSANLAADPVWMRADGEKIPLLHDLLKRDGKIR